MEVTAMKRIPSMYLSITTSFLLALLVSYQRGVTAEECGTRFTDFTSSVVLAEVVMQGSVDDFNLPSGSSRLHSANVSMVNVYKGMDVLKSAGQMDSHGMVEVTSFGQESKGDCVASDSDNMKGKEMVFFLRRSPEKNMMEHSALPIPAEGNEKRRVKRSLCDTCIRPPTIRRLVCTNCARQPTIKRLKSRKVTLGKRAKLRCNVRGKPKPKISWFKGQVPITSGNGGITIRTTALSSTLVFPTTTMAHAGQYTCVASNDVGKSEKVVTLELSRKSRWRGRNQNNRNTPPTSQTSDPECDSTESNPCLNGATCLYKRELDLRYCICRPYYVGARCQMIDKEHVLKLLEIENNREQNPPSTTPPTTISNTQSLIADTTLKTPTKSLQISSQPTLKPDTNLSSINETNQNFPSKSSQSNVNNTTINNMIIKKRLGIVVDKPNEPHTPSPIVPTAGNSHSRSNLFPKPKTKRKSVYSSNGERLSKYPVRSKSSLKAIPCQEKDYCFNKGKCRYVRKLGVQFCHCRTGYGGKQCELSLF